jgi:glyoxylase I family protein
MGRTAREDRMIEIESYHHVAIYVDELEPSVRFYGEVLGLRELPRPEIRDEGAWFELGNGQQLHVTVLTEPKVTSKRHFALEVKNFGEALRVFRANAVNIDGEPRKRDYDGSDSLIIFDPDGHRIEIVHHP